MLVVGLDGYRRGWVAVALENGRFHAGVAAPGLGRLLARWPDAAAIAIDIPLGLPVGSTPRSSEIETRALLGGRRASLFLMPPQAVFDAATHAEAIAMARQLGVPAPSAQAFALRTKIFEAMDLAASGVALHEVHPELAFRMLAGAPLPHAKRSWEGLEARRSILRERGIELPLTFEGAGEAAPDDVLDAAVAALVAHHIALGDAQSLPARPGESEVADRIWYWAPEEGGGED